MNHCVGARCPSVLLAVAALGVVPVTAWSQPIEWFPGGRYEHAIAFGQDVHLVTIDLCAPGVSVRTTEAGERGQTVSGFGRAVRAAMAVNGDFFAPGFNPDGPAMGNGHLWGGVDHPYVAPISFGLHGVHLPHHALTEGAAPFATQVISGHPTLLEHGVTVGNPDDPLCTNGNPRTAIGLTADHRTLLVLVADGRRPGVIGLTCDLAAALLRDHGAYDAVNLDGGGSATLYHGFLGVVNQPSDGHERVVANHLAILATGSGEAPQCPVREPRCPATGRSLVCTDRTHVATCFEGVLSSPGDCAAYGALCSTALPTGVGCANAFCVSGPMDPPRAHEACVPDGRIVHCLASGGIDNVRACPAGAVCQGDGASAACAPPGTVPPRDAGADVPFDAPPRDVPSDRPTEDARVDDAPEGPSVVDAAVMAGDVAPASLVEGGCGCRTASARSSAAGGVGWMVLLALAARRRRGAGSHRRVKGEGPRRDEG